MSRTDVISDLVQIHLSPSSALRSKRRGIGRENS
jgi:hypothetical protein